MIEHCISSLKLNKEEKAEEKAFKVYISDALMAIAENTTHLVGMQGVVDYGKTINTRWIDILEPPPKPKEDNRPADVIAADIWSRINKRATT